MKAIQKYKSTYKTNREHGRRIAQSLGYKTTIYDMPKMIALMARAGILIDGVDYEKPKQPDTTFVDDPVAKLHHEMQQSDKGTINIA